MLERSETPKELALDIDGIESQLDKSPASQGDAIKKSLIEPLNRNLFSSLAELKVANERIQSEIKGHLDRALSCREMIEKLSGQAYGDLEKISDLTLELEGIRHRAGEETDRLRKHLEENCGVKAQFEMAFETRESGADVRQEMLKMKKVRELLEAGRETAPAERPEAAPMTETRVDAKTDANVEHRTARTSALADFYAQEPAAPEAADPEEPGNIEQEELRMLVDHLAQYRKTESVLNGTEFAYFLNGKKMVLDSEAFVATVVRISDVAKALHVNLGQKEMSKDLFLIKQEILNQQEILRKAFLRVVRFCEKEDGAIPQHVADVINVRILKDILERLTFGNWSTPADFSSFAERLAGLKTAFHEKVTPSRDYLDSVIKQLEGGPDTSN